MQKKKDGTVIASLTEVKNKTGDIFALADEFGEVILTSYNKPRYKIIKLDISNVLDLTEKISEKPAQRQEKPRQKVELPVEQVHTTPEVPTLINRFIDVTPWNRNNDKEVSLVSKATKGLLN